MTTPGFVMFGEDEAGVCVDGVCAVPDGGAATSAPATTPAPTSPADASSEIMVTDSLP